MRFLVRRKTIICQFASVIAQYQQKADAEYYKDTSLKENKNDHASWLLDQSYAIQKMCRQLMIEKDVFEEAYKIYDFRNSGKEGYTLKDGKIVKVN